MVSWTDPFCLSQVNTEAAQAALRELASKVDGPRRAELMQVLGKGLETDLQAHFLRKNARGNKRNFPRQNFWARIRTATNFTGAIQDNPTVAIADPTPFSTPAWFAVFTRGKVSLLKVDAK